MIGGRWEWIRKPNKVELLVLKPGAPYVYVCMCMCVCIHIHIQYIFSSIMGGVEVYWEYLNEELCQGRADLVGDRNMFRDSWKEPGISS